MRALETLRPSPPLGLASTDPDAYRLESVSFGPGDTLLLYTDGVIEARDAEGDFYPILDRAAAWTWETPIVCCGTSAGTWTSTPAGISRTTSRWWPSGGVPLRVRSWIRASLDRPCPARPAHE
ncbi:SpoIIE family protein phosphatase [Streptomyces chiangmaiensis]